MFVFLLLVGLCVAASVCPRAGLGGPRSCCDTRRLGPPAGEGRLGKETEGSGRSCLVGSM